MKPCFAQRKPLSLLAANSLEPAAEARLRAHFKTCPGCRAYLEEISAVTTRLGQVHDDIESSGILHNRVLARIRAEDPVPSRSPIWQWTLAAAGTVGCIIIFWSLLTRPPQTQTAPPQLAASLPAAKAAPPSEPSLALYQKVANRSIDTLDDLLARQANHASHSAQTYTASSLRIDALD